MIKKPMVSVIMSTYNEEIEWVSKSIESILNQTYENFEFLIVIDNPNNRDIEKMVDLYSQRDHRIVKIKNEKNVGLTSSLNKVLNNCKGTYIARMDADDISVNTRFEKQIEFLSKNNSIGLVGTNAYFIDESDSILWKGENIPESSISIKKLITYVNFLIHPSWMFRKSILNDIKAYRDIKYAEDYDFILRLVTLNINIANINEYLIYYRVRNNSISQSNNLAQIKAGLYTKKLYNKRLKYNIDNYDKNKFERYIKCSNLENKLFIYSKMAYFQAAKYKKSKNKFLFFLFTFFSSIISPFGFIRNYYILLYKIRYILIKDKYNEV